MIRFIGVSFGVVEKRIVCIASSCGYSALEPKGFTTREAVSFLSSLSYPRDLIRRQQGSKVRRPAMVMFNSAVDLELLMQDLRPTQKDVLFGVYREKENRDKTNPLFDPCSQEYKGIVDALGYRLSLLSGKQLKIAKRNRSGLVFFDIAGFFDCDDLNEAANRFLSQESERRIEKADLELLKLRMHEELLARCEREAETIANLADRVYEVVEPLGLGLQRWYGPSAVAARCLHKWEARKQAKRLHDRNAPYELLKAIDCAYFGGRVEVFKLGTVERVNTYDLNSAYAYATTLLSKFVKPLRFTRRFDVGEPFSVWLCEYELPSNTIIGPLPTRHSTGGISYRKRGKGYFWQPEIQYLAVHYPDCFGIKWGYVGDYQQVSFAGEIEKLYDYRNELKAKGEPLEKVIKLALANLYGKFAQNQGEAYFQCRAWAGWITSFVRRLLLDAVRGVEDQVICFCQDAVHLANDTKAAVSQGDLLGQWKTQNFASGLYVAPGIYDLREQGQSVKQATRGGNLGLDFVRIAGDLTAKQTAQLERSFFVGWQLYRQQELKFQQDYLQEVVEALNITPMDMKARNYRTQFDWTSDYRDSEINSHFSGRLSTRYQPQDQTHQAALRLRLRDRGWA